MKSFLGNIKTIGAVKWLDENPTELTIAEYNSLILECHKLFIGIQRDIDFDIQDSLWLLYSRLTKGLTHEIISRSFESSIKNIVDDRYVKGYAYTGNIITFSVGSLGKFKMILRWLKYNFQLNRFVLNANQFIVVENPNQEMKNYSNSLKKSIYFLDENYFLPVSKLPSNAIEKRVKVVALKFINGVNKLLKHKGVSCNDEFLEPILKNLESEIQNTLDINYYLAKTINKIKNKTLLIRNSGNMLIRLISLAHKRSGGKVVGFSHGNNVGTLSDSSATSILMGVTNTFVTSNKYSKDLLDLSVKDHLEGKVSIEVFSDPNGYFQNMYNILVNDRVPSSINNIMVIEFPLSPWQYSWKIHLDLNIRRAKVIKKNKNIKLILKKHPDRLLESKGVYDEYYDEMITHPFESVYDLADLYIFSEISTTTFGFALMTNKPIMIFSNSLDQTSPDARKLLKKRCIVIDSWYSDEGKWMFDSQSMLEAISLKPIKPDQSYVQKYFLGINIDENS